MNIELNKNNFLIVIGLFLLALFLSLNNPMNPFVGQPASDIDVSVFRTVAMVMKNGGIPYQDSFDHKGPLLYIIYWWAGSVSWSHGIWWICFLSVSLTIIYMYKTARLFSERNIAYGLVFFSIAPAFHRYYQGGGYTEDLALPFIAIGVYYFVKWNFDKEINNKAWGILGASLAVVTLLRVNMIVVFICFLPLVLWECCSNRRYKYILISGAFFCLGICAVLLPVIYWLYANGIILDCWNSYIEFNRIYVEKSTPLWSERFTTLNWFFQHEGIFLTVLGALGLVVEKRNKFHAIYFVYIVLSLVSICLSGKKLGHYGVIMIPAMVYPIAFWFYKIYDMQHFRREKKIVLTVLIIIIVQLTVRHPLMDMYAMATNRYSENDVRYLPELVDVVNVIESKTDVSEKIVVVGNRDLLYLASNRLPAVQYSYQYPIAEVDSNIMNSFLEQINQVKPKIVVIEKKEKHKLLLSKIALFVDESYKMILDNKKYMVFEYVE